MTYQKTKKQIRLLNQNPTLCIVALGRKFTNPTLHARGADLEERQASWKRLNQMRRIQTTVVKELMVPGTTVWDKYQKFRKTLHASIVDFTHGQGRYLSVTNAEREYAKIAATKEASAYAHI